MDEYIGKCKTQEVNLLISMKYSYVKTQQLCLAWIYIQILFLNHHSMLLKLCKINVI